ncbi:MAG: hypothetical protein ACYC1T_09605 [Sulfuricaulis sp.]
MKHSGTSEVQNERLLGIIFGLVLIASLIALDFIYWDEVQKVLDELQTAHPVLYPSIAALFFGAFAYWIVSDIRHGKRKWEGIYIYRVFLFSATFVFFASQALYAIANAF